MFDRREALNIAFNYNYKQKWDLASAYMACAAEKIPFIKIIPDGSCPEINCKPVRMNDKAPDFIQVEENGIHAIYL